MSLHPALSFKGFRAVQEDYGLTPIQFAAYMTIALATDGKRGATPKPLSYATIAKRANISRRYAYTCAKKLQALKLLTWVGGSTGNTFQLLWGVERSSTLQGEKPAETGDSVVRSSTPTPEPAQSVVHSSTRVEHSSTLDPQSVVRSSTPIYQDKDKDKERDKDKSSTPPTIPDASDALLRHYEKTLGPLTPGLVMQLARLAFEYPEAWVKEAISVTEDRAKTSLKYTEGILKRYREEGKAIPGVPKPRKPDTIAPEPHIPTPEERAEISKLMRELKPDFSAKAGA